MSTNKYISFSNLTSFFNNLKNLFATKTEMEAKSDKSHTHSIANVSGLQSALDGKAASSHGTHVTYSTTAPVMDGTASVGSASTVARSDHKHPTDTSRAAQTSLDAHTSNTTSHITSAERTNWTTGYTHSQAAHAPSNAEKNQNAFSNIVVGSTTVSADTVTDTITLIAGDNITITPDATNDKITISAKDTTYSLASFGITATAAELNKLDGVTATLTEINYLDGVASNIQTQLDGKAASSHAHDYLPLSGGTVSGQLDVDKVFRNGNTFYNVLEFARTDSVDEIVIKTKIPFISSNSMPIVHLKGYAYGEASTIEMTVAFYIYNNSFVNMGVVSSCPWKPRVYLSSYTENNTKYVAISLSGSIYYVRFVVDYTDIWTNSSNRDYSFGWTSSSRADGVTTSIIPTADKVEVPYRAIANNIDGNAATASAVNWSGVTGKPSYYDAKAIKSITRNGTTFTYTCMDGTTGTFTQQDNNTTYSAATTSTAGLMSAADKTKLDSIALTVNSDGILMLSV